MTIKYQIKFNLNSTVNCNTSEKKTFKNLNFAFRSSKFYVKINYKLWGFESISINWYRPILMSLAAIRRRCVLQFQRRSVN